MAESTSDFLVRRLTDWGVKRVYGYPGDGINGVFGALNRADVTVYPINLLDTPDQPQFVHQTLQRIANDTNGQYFQFNTSFAPALRTVEKLSNGYYLISYATQKAAGQRGFQKVNVAVKNADFRVRARRGYTLGD